MQFLTDGAARRQSSPRWTPSAEYGFCPSQYFNFEAASASGRWGNKGEREMGPGRLLRACNLPPDSIIAKRKWQIPRAEVRTVASGSSLPEKHGRHTSAVNYPNKARKPPPSRDDRRCHVRPLARRRGVGAPWGFQDCSSPDAHVARSPAHYRSIAA